MTPGDEEGGGMARNDRVVELNQDEHNLMVNGLNDFRKAMEEQDVPTEDIEDLLLKVIDAPARPGKWWQDRETR